jgi:hypothetical protein
MLLIVSPRLGWVVRNGCGSSERTTIRSTTGRSRATGPDASCGASRVTVAATVKQSAPKRPNHEPVHRFPGVGARHSHQRHGQDHLRIPV